MKPKMEYIALCGSIVGSGPFRTEYAFDGKRFPERAAAISHGFTLGRSDDFNIGVLRDGKLISVDWMEKTIDASPELMAWISKEISL
jgi:hypothetical protein